MRKATLRNLLAQKLRLGLTVLAIALGVALVAGTLTLTSAMTAGSATLPSASQADVVVRGRTFDALRSIPGQQPSPRHPIPASVADRVTGVDGVAAVRGVASGPVSLLEPDGRPLGPGGATVGTSVTDVSGLPAQVMLAGGRLPASGEAVMDATTAREQGYAIGDQIQVAGADGRASTLILAGTLQTSELPGLVVGFDLPAAQRLLGRAGRLDELHVAAAPGLGGDVLRDRVGASAGTDYQVLAGADLQAQRQETIQEGVRTVGQTMVWFVIVSLLIGAFLIANAFSITIAQRTRELALLRCLGATTAQIRNAVLLEALVTGVAASALGALLGPLVAAALAQQFSRLGRGLAADPSLGDFLDVAPSAVLGSVAVGVLVTVVSALLPARRATAIAPLAAMREAPVSRSNG